MEGFYDNLDVIDDAPIMVKANINFLSTEEGGRQTPLFGSTAFRPNHNFGGSSNRHYYIGQVQFDKDDVISPGDSRVVDVVFLNVRGLRELLAIGATWRIQEGSILIGTGKVLDVKT